MSKIICNDCIFFRNKDCQLGRISTFRNRGELVEIGEIIELQRFCNTKRDQKWKDKHHRAIIDVLNEVKTKIDLIILDKVDEILAQNLPVNHTYIVQHIDSINRTYLEYANEKITTTVVMDGDLISAIIPQLTGEYVLILDKPFEFDLNKVNYKLNYKLEKIALIKEPYLINKAILTLFCMNEFNKDKLDTIKKDFIWKWSEL